MRLKGFPRSHEVDAGGVAVLLCCTVVRLSVKVRRDPLDAN